MLRFCFSHSSHPLFSEILKLPNNVSFAIIISFPKYRALLGPASPSAGRKSALLVRPRATRQLTSADNAAQNSGPCTLQKSDSTDQEKSGEQRDRHRGAG